MTGQGEELRAMSDKATPGRWGIFGMTLLASTDGTSNADTATEVAQGLTADAAGRPRTFDVDFIAALVNAYRDGLLVPVGPLREFAEELERIAERTLELTGDFEDAAPYDHSAELLAALLDRLTTPTVEEADR